MNSRNVFVRTLHKVAVPVLLLVTASSALADSPDIAGTALVEIKEGTESTPFRLPPDEDAGPPIKPRDATHRDNLNHMLPAAKGAVDLITNPHCPTSRLGASPGFWVLGGSKKPGLAPKRLIKSTVPKRDGEGGDEEPNFIRPDWSSDQLGPLNGEELRPAVFEEYGSEEHSLAEYQESARRRGPNESLRLEAEFGEGFALVSPDEEFELRIHILNQVDYKAFSPNEQEPAAQDGVYIPRMRVYFEGKLTDPFRYEVSLQRSVEGQFDLLDANLDIRFSEGFQIRFGRTLIPYSYTWYDHLEQYFIAPERPLFPLNFGLARAAGFQIWGEDEGRAWQYSFGVYDGRVAGLADDSTTVDGVGYLNVRPFLSRTGGLLEFLNVGGSLVVGENKRPAELLPLRTSIQSSENDEAAESASAIFLEFNPDIVGRGDRLIGAVHVASYYGPVSFEAEWNAVEGELFNEATDESVRLDASGFHVTLASFLTGETVRGRGAVAPLRPFDPRCGCSQLGALEVYGRFSYLQLDDDVFDRGLADGDAWTNEVKMTDIGVNWYPNRFTKFYLNWQHASYGQPVLINEETDAFSIYNDLAWLRCQLYF